MSIEEMSRIAGGAFGNGECAPDGEELGCFVAYHHLGYQKENDIWCKKDYYCNESFHGEINYRDIRHGR